MCVAPLPPVQQRVLTTACVLRVACAYRMVSGEAVAVIASMIPIDLLARERKQIYDRIAKVRRAEAADEARR